MNNLNLIPVTLYRVTIYRISVPKDEGIRECVGYFFDEKKAREKADTYSPYRGIVTPCSAYTDDNENYYLTEKVEVGA